MKLEVVKHDEAKRAFVLVPRRWAARFRRVARDYERLAATLCGYHCPPFVTRMLNSLTGLKPSQKTGNTCRLPPATTFGKLRA